MNGKYSFPDDNFLLWRKKKKTKFTVSSKLEIIREMKVKSESGENPLIVDVWLLNFPAFSGAILLCQPWLWCKSSRSSFPGEILKCQGGHHPHHIGDHGDHGPHHHRHHQHHTSCHHQEESVRLPDGNMIVMGQQKFSAPEIIFQVYCYDHGQFHHHHHHHHFQHDRYHNYSLA